MVYGREFMKTAKKFSAKAKAAHNSKVRMTYGKPACLNDSE